MEGLRLSSRQGPYPLEGSSSCPHTSPPIQMRPPHTSQSPDTSAVDILLCPHHHRVSGFLLCTSAGLMDAKNLF